MSIKKCGLPISNLEEGEVECDEFEKDDVACDEFEEEGVGCDENVEPFFGMEFSSDLEARQFYNSYACRLGFSIRVHTTRTTKVGLSSIRMVCSRQGFSTRSSPAKRRNLRSLKENAGGIDKICFSKKDINNQIVKENMRFAGVDVETTLGYFNKKQKDDPEFFFAIETEGNGVVQNILWIDGKARRAYAEFGDVVTFDTTYNTNKYCMLISLY
ncbi:protein FAR1-RELATED SEQUENCE 7-like [Carex rostrata]